MGASLGFGYLDDQTSASILMFFTIMMNKKIGRRDSAKPRGGAGIHLPKSLGGPQHSRVCPRGAAGAGAQHRGFFNPPAKDRA
jgi:hypothetical protein